MRKASFEATLQQHTPFLRSLARELGDHPRSRRAGRIPNDIVWVGRRVLYTLWQEDAVTEERLRDMVTTEVTLSLVVTEQARWLEGRADYMARGPRAASQQMSSADDLMQDVAEGFTRASQGEGWQRIVDDQDHAHMVGYRHMRNGNKKAYRNAKGEKPISEVAFGKLGGGGFLEDEDLALNLADYNPASVEALVRVFCQAETALRYGGRPGGSVVIELGIGTTDANHPPRVVKVPVEHAQIMDIQSAFRRLPPAEARAVLLVGFWGYTQADAAKTLGVSQPTVSRNFRYGLMTMATLLTGKDYSDEG